MKLLWTGIKSIISIKNSQVNVINKLKDANGNLTTDSYKMAAVFNDFFVNVADGVTKRLPRSPKSPLDYLKSKSPHSFFITPSVPVEVSDIIYMLKTGKSIGPNSIPIKLLKYCLLIYLLHCLKSSMIPSHLVFSLKSCNMQKSYLCSKKAVL